MTTSPCSNDGIALYTMRPPSSSARSPSGNDSHASSRWSALEDTAPGASEVCSVLSIGGEAITVASATTGDGLRRPAVRRGAAGRRAMDRLESYREAVARSVVAAGARAALLLVRDVLLVGEAARAHAA